MTHSMSMLADKNKNITLLLPLLVIPDVIWKEVQLLVM